MVLLCWANQGLASCKKVCYIDRGGSPHQLTGLDTLPYPFVAGLKREKENHSSNVCRINIYIYIYMYEFLPCVCNCLRQPRHRAKIMRMGFNWICA